MRGRDPAWWQLPAVLAASAAYEVAFLFRGLGALDEGWPLYAAMRLHAGGTLYDDVFWVFPPGHVLAAWLGAAWHPPGITAARAVYAAFTVALCGALYLLGRRLMPASFALLGALLLAVAAPRSHEQHLVFGYRYLAFSAFALLAFARRLDGGDRRWMALAGALAGVALCFRISPAFAVSAAIGVGLLAAGGGWRRWLGDGAAFAVALLAVVSPVALWLALSVGLDHAAVELAIRPFSMLQPLSWPALELPDAWSRNALTELFVALQFRLWWLLYAGYAIGLLALRARGGRRSEHALLAAVVVWGAIYFTRSLGRSDEAHLDSAIPPLCLLLAHLLSVALARAGARLRVAAQVAVLVAWIGLLGIDRSLWPGRQPLVPVRALDESLRAEATEAWMWTTRVRRLRDAARPDETILILSAAPMYHPLTGRLGPGYADVIMPGTFRDEEEERGFLRRLVAAPPAAVVWPEEPFDDMPERAVEKIAPRIAEWVRQHYEPAGRGAYHAVLVPRVDR